MGSRSAETRLTKDLADQNSHQCLCQLRRALVYVYGLWPGWGADPRGKFPLSSVRFGSVRCGVVQREIEHDTPHRQDQSPKSDAEPLQAIWTRSPEFAEVRASSRWFARVAVAVAVKRPNKTPENLALWDGWS